MSEIRSFYSLLEEFGLLLLLTLPKRPNKMKTEFEKAAADESSPSTLGEFWEFLRYNKKWWLLPIIIVLLLFGLLLALSSSGAAPFIYTLF